MDASAAGEALPSYADVIVPRGPHRPFTYLIPSLFRTSLAVGQRVIVPFRSTTVEAVVTALHHRLPSGIERRHVKEIHALADGQSDAKLSKIQFQLSQWLSERFLAPWGQCVRLVAPASHLPTRKSTKWMITSEGRKFLTSPHKRSPIQHSMLQRLARRPSGLTWKTLKRSMGEAALAARLALVRRGLVAQREVDISAAPRAVAASRSRFVEPGLDGQEAIGHTSVPLPEHIRCLWDSTISETIVLQAGHEDRMGILLQAVKETLDRQRRVLIVAGVVSRAADIAQALTRAGIREVLLFHGKLPERVKTLAWHSMASRSVTVVVGTRSAACGPFEELGLVWVEGEDDTALKEEQSPRYHARELARKRAQLDHAVLVLASAHPSLESRYAAMTGQAVSWSVPVKNKRVSVETVDLRRFPSGTLVTPPVMDGIRAALAERKLVVLFVNRKGYAALLLCRTCGEALSCPACSLALRLHKKIGSLLCHACGYKRDVPDVCPACQAVSLEPLGAGTERVEEFLRHHFPSIRIARMDGDTIRRPAQVRALLALARSGEVDVMIGTQMLFVHGEIPHAGLVAVLNADSGLHMPDFRSAEATYHVLLDALSLADMQGRTLIQTYLPHHHAVEAVLHDKPSLFLDTELAFREALHYPPFTHLVRLDVSGTSERQVGLVAHRWAASLERIVASEGRALERRSCSAHDGDTTPRRSVAILGPAPAPVSLLRRRYHWRLLIRSCSQEDVLRVVRQTLPEMEAVSRAGGIRCTVDVDPVTML
jgi:primosomal protein N' (replication factor Y)